MLFRSKSGCQVLVHINSDETEKVPSYKRILGFKDICQEQGILHELVLRDLGSSYDKSRKILLEIFNYIKDKYPGMKKGLFMANDTHANIMLNIIFNEYGTLPDDFCIVGFDDSPIASEAVIPISTVGQQIDKIAYEAAELLVKQIDRKSVV